MQHNWHLLRGEIHFKDGTMWSHKERRETCKEKGKRLELCSQKPTAITKATRCWKK